MGLPLLFAIVAEPSLAWSVAAVTACGLGGLVAFSVVWPRLRGRLARFRLIAPIVGLANEFHQLLWSRAILAIGAVAICIHLISAATIVASASALDVDLPMSAALVLTPPIVLVTMLPISLAGWGVREGAMVVGLAQLGIGSDAAILVSVLFGLGQMASSLPGGVLWLLARPSAAPSPDPGGPGA